MKPKVIISLNTQSATAADTLLSPSKLPSKAKKALSRFTALAQAAVDFGIARPKIVVIDDEDGSDESDLYHFKATYDKGVQLAARGFAALNKEFQECTVSIEEGKLVIYGLHDNAV